jgi:aldehyde dehydrogenase (NAD+)
VEIFGPVLVSMTFRTPKEAIELANNTPYGLAASIWTENINLALDVAPRVKAGTVWINCTNLFDAASGFGGYRESGFGREGGREGMFEYIHFNEADDEPAPVSRRRTPKGKQTASVPTDEPPIDQTPKLFIGGKQVRPDSGYSRIVPGADGRTVGEVGEGNRKDVRNAVEAAHAAAWASMTAHNRAQILYYIAENLATRQSEFAARLVAMTGQSEQEGLHEVSAAIERLFTFAAWADKFDGQVHGTPLRGVTLAMPEPIGVMGIVCPDDAPLLSFVSLVAPAIAMANTVVVMPSERYPLSATDLYQVFETSDLPAGVVNVVTGSRDALAGTLAEHDDVDGLWYFGDEAGVKAVEYASAGNMKRAWTHGRRHNWNGQWAAESEMFLRESTQVKNIWIPYGA